MSNNQALIGSMQQPFVLVVFGTRWHLSSVACLHCRPFSTAVVTYSILTAVAPTSRLEWPVVVTLWQHVTAWIYVASRYVIDTACRYVASSSITLYLGRSSQAAGMQLTAEHCVSCCVRCSASVAPHNHACEIQGSLAGSVGGAHELRLVWALYSRSCSLMAFSRVRLICWVITAGNYPSG